MSAQPLEARLESLERTIIPHFNQQQSRFNQIDARFGQTDSKFESRFNLLDQRFNWLIGIVMTSWVSTIVTILLHR